MGTGNNEARKTQNHHSTGKVSGSLFVCDLVVSVKVVNVVLIYGIGQQKVREARKERTGKGRS